MESTPDIAAFSTSTGAKFALPTAERTLRDETTVVFLFFVSLPSVCFFKSVMSTWLLQYGTSVPLHCLRLRRYRHFAVYHSYRVVARLLGCLWFVLCGGHYQGLCRSFLATFCYFSRFPERLV